MDNVGGDKDGAEKLVKGRGAGEHEGKGLKCEGREGTLIRFFAYQLSDVLENFLSSIFKDLVR